MRKPIKIKDPIYGYIEINDDVVYSIINSPLFHRLQGIIQTSYSSVYPSSIHNRFIHSIGVYYLGTLAVRGMQYNNKNDFDEIDKDIIKTFELACLLHDLGHSPFSHIGESFYELAEPNIWEKLKEALNNSDFNSNGKSKTGNPHEIMSALESITYFSHKIPEGQRAFFVRCIIGLRYSDKKDIRNCFIELLNSKTIDVDKLDYLIRDSYFTGFKSVSIDYERLLSAVCVVKKDNEYALGFTKSALSVLESVVLAHDMERKWIQMHPTIQYENFLLTSIIGNTVDLYKKENIDLFSLEALTEQGVFWSPDTCLMSMRLLSDSDILFYAKNYFSKTDASREYFDRQERRKPLWKTEAEYKICIENKLGEDSCKKLEEIVLAAKQTLENFYKSKNNLPLINDEFLDFIESELDNCSRIEPSAIITEDDIRKKKKNLQAALKLTNMLKKFSKENGYQFDYVLILNKHFSSNFNKDELKNLPILFENNKTELLGKSINLFEQSSPREIFFYFYVNKDDKDSFNTDKFVDMLNSFIVTYRIE